MTKALIQVGNTIHVFSSNADDPLMCLAAIVGGQMGGNWWLVVMNFTGSRIAWLDDERWHPAAGCTTTSGKTHTVNLNPSEQTKVRP